MTAPDRLTSSQQVSWWSVHEFVAPTLARFADYPMAGTPAWRALADDDPRKIAALFDAAQHHALRVETAQTALAEASREISDAADWSAVGRHIRDEAELYRERPWLSRTAS